MLGVWIENELAHAVMSGNNEAPNNGVPFTSREETLHGVSGPTITLCMYFMRMLARWEGIYVFSESHKPSQTYRVLIGCCQKKNFVDNSGIDGGPAWTLPSVLQVIEQQEDWRSYTHRVCVAAKCQRAHSKQTRSLCGWNSFDEA